ncbi:N-acyl-D-amino-acid deacylase family protein [Pelosinus fermentans]|uniref:N-acyl-D-glutamate deacylase n=1 Tax=Pelosinus fermentans JBW45 TaxID=1192197 RepID=I8TTA3_9FIRM|nr:amidohydrolase family protein [Pelosinus fermentans]AJQ28885.1 N-acyl-D-glutamate deacylase [Pelosinus fermentans JBW45]
MIRNGILIDPETLTRSRGNIGIVNGKIEMITKDNIQGLQEFDVEGKMVCPGFIDIHGHVDWDDYCGELSLRQGITTTVGGNCGLSPLDINAFFAAQEKQGFIVNQAELIGHSISLREEVGATDPLKPATPEQLRQMEYLVEKALEEGACGLSLGLAYAPGSSNDEIMNLSKIAARYGRIVAVDTRMITGIDMYSLVEVIAIARQTGARIQVSHFVYQYGTGVMEEALSVINRARFEGLDIRFDSGMYTQWATHIGAVLFNEEYMETNGWKLDDILVITGKYNGQRLTMDIYHELRTQHPHTAVVVFTGIEEEIYMALNHPYAMPSTDTGTYLPGEGHPQIAGSFPRYFKKMVTERYELNIMEAVRKATLLPAETLGFTSKGRLRKGMDADIVVFDIKNITDKAVFGQPNAHPEGIDYVFLNGKLALAKGELMDTKAGKAVRCNKPVYDYQI